MSTFNLTAESPLGIFKQFCEEGKLAYQVTPSGQAVFYPRIVAPQTGETLSWQISNGEGTVYSTSVIHLKGIEPYNIALIDLDEGFRMMSRVEEMPPEKVSIGMRVKMKMSKDKEGRALPVFVQGYSK
ncbi:MAG: Zn-ribbon domain-containing OB-fold protein [Burkholderiaceae bacterium]